MNASILALLAISLTSSIEAREAVLDLVLERVEQTLEAGEVPVVVLDLDDTLLSARERTLRVVRDFARLPEILQAFPVESQALGQTEFTQIRYDLADTLAGIGINNADFSAKSKVFWVENFFSDMYCVDDQPIHGATSYLRALVRAGAHIVYLTGRDTPRMGLGTRINLRKLRFPLGSHAELMMKPTPTLPDLDFKKQALIQIGSQGTVVGVFENEPANLNAMVDAYPEATAVFLDTIHSNRPDVPYESAVSIQDYR